MSSTPLFRLRERPESSLSWAKESMSIMERRRLERFNLTAPARVVVESEDGETEKLHLTTKDVSSAGAYLYCLQPLVAGTRVRIEMLIHPDTLRKVAADKGRARIRVRGKVIRVDADGIAVRFETRYKISALGDGNRAARLILTLAPGGKRKGVRCGGTLRECSILYRQ